MGKNNHKEPAGSVAIEDAVVADYAVQAILSVDGVVRLVGGIADSLSRNILGRDTGTQGIRITREEDHVTVSVHLVAAYGVNIPQLSYDIQNRAKESIETYTGLTVDAINISVEGIERK